MKKAANSYKYLIVIAIILITVLYLRPLLLSGWYFDDQSNSLFRESAALNKLTLGGYLKIFFAEGGRVPGRFYPLAGYAFLLFDIVRNLLFYKYIVLSSIILCIYLFYHLIKRLSGDENVALLSCVIIPVFFQFRYFYDPILSFAALMPLIFSLTFSSLIFLDRFLETGKWKYYVLSLILYTISLYTYEITYLFFILHLSIIYFRKKKLKDVFRYGIPFIGSLSIATIGSVYTRIQYQAQIGTKAVATYSVHFIPKIFFLTVLKQLYAALPFSYSLSNPNQLLTLNLRERLSNIHFLGIIIVGLFLLSYFTLIKKIKLSATTRKRFLIFGLLLFTLPGLMIALSNTYQNLLVFGNGYLPVFIQYFGACILLIGIASYISLKVRSNIVKQFLSVILAVTISVIYLINIQNNRFIVEDLNLIYWYPRNVLEVSAKNGIFDKVPTVSTLIMESDDTLSLDYPAFIYLLTKRDIFTLNSKKILTWYQGVIKSKSPPIFGSAEKYFINKGPVYFYRYWSDSVKQGYVVIAKVSDFQIDPDFKKTPVKTESLEIFLLGDIYLEQNISFTKLSLDSKGTIESKSVITVPKNDFKIIKKSKQSSLFRVPIKLDVDNWIDFQSVRLNPMPEPPYP